MRYKTIKIILLMIILMLPLVYAETQYVFKRGDATDITVACYESDNSFCENATRCNITINYPDGSNLINNKEMSFNPSFYNYSLLGSQLNKNGEYSVSVGCTDGTNHDFTSFGFDVNLAGRRALDNPASLGITIFIILITLGIFFLPIIIKEFSSNEILNMVIKHGLVLIGMYFLTLDAAMITSLSDTYGVGVDSAMFMFLWIIQKTTYFAMFIIVIHLIFKSINLWNTKKHNQRMGIDY